MLMLWRVMLREMLRVIVRRSNSKQRTSKLSDDGKYPNHSGKNSNDNEDAGARNLYGFLDVTTVALAALRSATGLCLASAQPSFARSTAPNAINASCAARDPLAPRVKGSASSEGSGEFPFGSPQKCSSVVCISRMYWTRLATSRSRARRGEDRNACRRHRQRALVTVMVVSRSLKCSACRVEHEERLQQTTRPQDGDQIRTAEPAPNHPPWQILRISTPRAFVIVGQAALSSPSKTSCLPDLHIVMHTIAE